MMLRTNTRPPGNVYIYTAFLKPYIKNEQIWQCPSSQNHRYTETAGGDRGYMSTGHNWYFADRDVSHASIEFPAEVAVWGDTFNGDTNAGYRGYEFSMYGTRLCNTYEALSTRHNDGANVGFADGHAKWMSLGALNGRQGVRFGPPW